MMPSLTRDLDVPFRKTGSLVLAGRGGEKGLLELLERAKANGVDARIIDREEIDKSGRRKSRNRQRALRKGRWHRFAL